MCQILFLLVGLRLRREPSARAQAEDSAERRSFAMWLLTFDATTNVTELLAPLIIIAEYNNSVNRTFVM